MFLGQKEELVVQSKLLFKSKTKEQSQQIQKTNKEF
jgi:hypothetical protein